MCIGKDWYYLLLRLPFTSVQERKFLKGDVRYMVLCGRALGQDSHSFSVLETSKAFTQRPPQAEDVHLLLVLFFA